MPGEGYDEVLTVFQASPLVMVDTEDGDVQPMESFNLDREYEQLPKVLGGGSVKVRVDQEILTATRFQEFLSTKESHVVHFACSGTDEHLFMEKKRGVVDKIPLTQVSEWVAASTNLELVVVADSNAQVVADAFLQSKSGVRHVVCCPVDKYKLDHSAAEFIKIFYHGLGCSKTVQQAFDEACTAVKNSTHLTYSNDGASQDAASRYQLLPKGQSHDDVMFHDNGRQIAAPLSSKVPPRILPLPPPVFLGRQKDIYQLLQDVEAARLIRVSGFPSGAGAAGIVKMACQYMGQRVEDYEHEEIVWLPPKMGIADEMTSLCLRVFEPLINFDLPQEEDVALLVKELNKMKLLIVCDIRKSRSKDVFDGMMDFLDELFEHSPTTKAIIIYEAADMGKSTLQYSSTYIEKSISVNPLGYTSTVTLFGLLCSHVFKRTSPSITSVEDLKNLLVPAAGYVGNKQLKKTIVSIYSLLGQGVPSRIRELASSMTTEEYQSLIAVGKLRDKLSRLFQRQVELAFPTRFSLDVHLNDLSGAAEDARSARQHGEVNILEAQFAEAGQRRQDLASVETMLIKRKALKTERNLAKLCGRHEAADKMKAEITGLEKAIEAERQAMIDADEDWIQISYVEFPKGISRRTIEERYEARMHLFIDARKTKDFPLARDLEYPLKELRESRNLLPTVEEWVEKVDELSVALKQAEMTGDVDKVVELSDEVEQMEQRIDDENGEVDTARIAADLYIPLHAFLRYTGDKAVTNLPEFERIASRGQVNECLALIIEKSESSSDELNIDRCNKLVGLYQELCAIASTKFPSIESLLIERKGFRLEEKLVYSQDAEIVKAYEIEIEAIEQRILRERRNSSPDQFYGVCKTLYLNGITRALVDERIDELKDALERANDEGNVFGIAELELKLSELAKHQESLPNEYELGILIERTIHDMEQISSRSGTEEKQGLMARAAEDLKIRIRSEENPEDRPKEDIADDLMIPVADYFYPPSLDDSIRSVSPEDIATYESDEDEADLSVVNEEQAIDDNDWQSGNEY